MKKIIALALCAFMLSAVLSGCTDKRSVSENESTTQAILTETDFSVTADDMFSDRDMKGEYSADEAVKITLADGGISSSSDSVKINGSTVTLTEEATYIVSGELTDGQIVVEGSDTAKLQIVLNGVKINSETSAPIYVKTADKVFVTLADSTENELSNGGEFVSTDENNIDAVIFSKQDMTFNGSGTLTVNSPAGHGIACKDDLVAVDCKLTINSASHGLDANDSIRLSGAKITADSGKDGLHCENSEDSSLGFVYIADGEFNIAAAGDGISAGNFLQINGGSFDIVTGGGSENGTKQSSDSYGNFMGGGMHGGQGGSRPMNRPVSLTTSDTTETDDSSTSIKGLKATGSMLINDGDFNINSADDAVHSNLSVTVKDGAFQIASGDDGFHADETLSISSGDIDITECYEGLEALNITVNGGNIKVKATDDGLNAAGGVDSSGTGGRGGDMFGGGFGSQGGGMSSSSKGSIVIMGGELYINSSGDGMDANGYIEISDGYITVVGPTQGDTATLDYDTTATITGGTFIGTGASGMAQTFSDNSQGVIALSVNVQEAGTAICLKDSDGNTVINCSPELSFGVVILSSPYIVSGETYTVEIGSYSGEFQAD